MNTVIDNIQVMAAALQHDLEVLFVEYSSLKRHERHDGGGLVFISVSGNHSFEELPAEGRRLQSKVIQDYRRFSELLKTLLNGASEKSVTTFEEARKRLSELIQQNQSTWATDPQGVLKEAKEALSEHVALVEDLYRIDASATFVPDTNALLMWPALPDWRFDEATKFEIILVPTVLGELDQLKINHRNDKVREKARRLVKQIKQYRGRGRLTAGVVLTHNVSSIRALAVEPRAETVLSWLNGNHADDRILATTIDVMRTRSHSPVALVTEDINLQNKAEFAGVPFLEPPIQDDGG